MLAICAAGGRALSVPPQALRWPAQGCVKLLAALLRACPEYAPPVAQLRDLVGWAFADLSDAASRPQLFSLLKAILDRKLVAVAEVHSVMTRLQVRTGACPHARAPCTGATP